MIIGRVLYQRERERERGTDRHTEIERDFLQDECRLDALLGTWSGHSVTRRSGVYGSTLVEEDTLVTFSLEDNGNLIQVIFQLFDVCSDA